MYARPFPTDGIITVIAHTPRARNRQSFSKKQVEYAQFDYLSFCTRQMMVAILELDPQACIQDIEWDIFA